MRVRGAGRRSAVVALVLGVLVATLTACGGGGDAGGGQESKTKPLEVVQSFETFVDTSRPTQARGEVAGKPTRTLETFVYHPAPGSVGGPFPLIVFSHGSGVTSPVRYELLFRAWVAAGYVVAAPKYPLTSTSLPESGADLVNQPADISFLIGELLRRNEDQASPYRGLIDGNRIGAAGHSLGAVTTLGVAFNGCCLDPRIKAGVVLSGAESGFPADRWFDGGGIRTPLLVVHGDEDRIIRLAEGQKVFADAPPPKAMLTVFGGDHNRPFGGSLATVENPERLGATEEGPTRLVNRTVVGFLDRYLKERADALSRLRTGLADEVSVKLEVVEK